MLRADFNPVLAATFSSVLVVIPLSIETIFTSISTKAYDFIFFYLSYLRYYTPRMETTDVATHHEAIIDWQQSSVLIQTLGSRMYKIGISWILRLKAVAFVLGQIFKQAGNSYDTVDHLIQYVNFRTTAGAATASQSEWCRILIL